MSSADGGRGDEAWREAPVSRGTLRVTPHRRWGSRGGISRERGSSYEEVFEEIADGAASESELWASALLPGQRAAEPVFATLLPEQRFALGVETIYEGYLLHYGRARLFAPTDDDVALLLGDALLAHGLVRIAGTGSLEAVADLAKLLSLCAQARADGLPGDGPAWAATAALLGRGGLGEARDALRDRRDPARLEALARQVAGGASVDAALAAHERLVR